MVEPPARNVRDFIGPALAMALGIAAIAFSGDFSPLGSVFPRTIAGLMVVLGASCIVLAWRRPGPRSAGSTGSWPRRLGTMGVMLAWAFALQPLGFLFTSACATVALLLFAQHDRWTARTGLLYLFSSACVVGGLYTLFRFVLQVPLPIGVFW